MKNHSCITGLPKVLALVALLFSSVVGRADSYHFYASLTGANEFPANASAGTGWADVYFDNFAHTLLVQVVFSGLSGVTTASHIHAPTSGPDSGVAGIATATPNFPGFPLGVTSGSYSQTFDLTQASSFNAAYVTNNGGTPAGAEAAFLSSLLANRAYLNVHTRSFPGGEIRGFLHVPDSGSTALMLVAGLGALAGITRRRQVRA